MDQTNRRREAKDFFRRAAIDAQVRTMQEAAERERERARSRAIKAAQTAQQQQARAALVKRVEAKRAAAAEDGLRRFREDCERLGITTPTATTTPEP